MVSVPSILPSSVVSLYELFWDAALFNDDNIGEWDTANVTNMSWLFDNADLFNQDISSWNTSNVTDMSWTFAGATSFNQDISSWNTSSVMNLRGMFSGAASFNKTLSGWDTGNATDMTEMFAGATSFNQSLEMLNVSNVTDMAGMLNGTSLSAENYGLTLIGWASRPVQCNVSFGAQGLSISNAGLDARTFLFGDYGWNIDDSVNVSGISTLPQCMR